jgi:hypothetical protein
MKVQRSAVAVLLSGLVAVTACGEDPQSSRPPAAPSRQVSASQVYYDLTHPDRAVGSGDVKDHPGYRGGISPEAWSGDVKDHPGYRGGISPETSTGDAKDHPGYRGGVAGHNQITGAGWAVSLKRTAPEPKPAFPTAVAGRITYR